MKYPLALFAALTVAVAISGCGGPDRSALAVTTVNTYWSDVDHGKFLAAYKMLTSGNRAVMNFSDYHQNMIGFLESVAGVKVTVGKVSVTDDRAIVAVGLHSPDSPSALKAWQHLFWENGGWKISDQNGGVSSTK